MTKIHLTKILSVIYPLYCKELIEKLYFPENSVIPITAINEIQQEGLCFDAQKHQLKFVEGSISGAGVELIFKHQRFEKISVNILYDFSKQKIYNSILALPSYTKKDWAGTKIICQTANQVRQDKDLEKYFNKLYRKFECPILN